MVKVKKEPGGHKVPITHDDEPKKRKVRSITEYARDYDMPKDSEIQFLDEKGLIAIGTVYRGQGRYLPWYHMEREPDAYDEEHDVYGWKITDEEIKHFPELKGRKGVCARGTSYQKDGRLGLEEVVRKGDEWVRLYDVPVIPKAQEPQEEPKRSRRRPRS